MKKIYINLILILLFIFACQQDNTRMISSQALQMNEEQVVDLELENDNIIAVTDFNSTNYFIYRGHLMGFQYELLQEFADHTGKKLDVIVENDFDKKFRKIARGEANLIASNLTVTRDRKNLVDFTIPYGETRQVLVQRKPLGWDEMKKAELDQNLIRNQLDLKGKVIFVKKGSVFANRLKNLSNEVGDTIFIEEVNKETEELIQMVAEGKINYTIGDEAVANLNQAYYENLDVSTPVSFPQHVAWAVRKGETELLEEVNTWLESFKRTSRYKVIYSKYYNHSNAKKYRESEFLAHDGGKISVFDDDIKRYSETIDWDWRLLASMIYQESRFNPDVRSWAGAYGLMQLMPRTAAQFGVDSTSSPVENIRAGVRFIGWLNNQFDDVIENEDERIKFILASYNAGYGHVKDAMRLAEKNDKNPYLWNDNVDFYLLNKSNPEYYEDPVVQFGYCRGREPYNYVYDILERYERYKSIVRN
jgi:membrane-bound lytic murein transglycosylase F